jgi:hypothetical protein
MQDCADAENSCKHGHHGHGPRDGNHHPHLNCSKEQCCWNIQPHTCFGYWPKDPRACSGHGYCHDWDVCYCERGWEGPECETENPVDECHGVLFDDPDVCYGHGECEEGVCTCESPWVGAFCQIYLLSCCKSKRSIRYCLSDPGVGVLVTGLSPGWSVLGQWDIVHEGADCEQIDLERTLPSAPLYPTLNVSLMDGTTVVHELTHGLAHYCSDYAIWVPALAVWPVVALAIAFLLMVLVIYFLMCQRRGIEIPLIGKRLRRRRRKSKSD